MRWSSAGSGSENHGVRCKNLTSAAGSYITMEKKSVEDWAGQKGRTVSERNTLLFASGSSNGKPVVP
jgi:hypothetical protein